jgi:hypothetical protein
VHSRRDIGVFFIPMTGAMMKNAPPAPPAAATQVKATVPAAPNE